MTAVLNAANERANELFRAEKLGYLGTSSYQLVVLILIINRMRQIVALLFLNLLFLSL